jgi:transposase InsO family protein
VVSSTAAKPVLKALGNIYDSYGNPEVHRTDNGPPFSSAAFDEFSANRGIEHKKVYEYHPQGNPADIYETFGQGDQNC